MSWLTPAAIKEFYTHLKTDSFYLEEKKEIWHWYEQRVEWNASSDKDEITKEKDAVLDAIGFAYGDDKPLIDLLDPAKTYTVIAIAAFLVDHNCPKSYLFEDVRRDLEAILNERKIKKQKQYFSEADYKELLKDEKKIIEWFSN